MIAASPLSADEYAMRMATQTESALICKEYSSRHHRERLLRWAGVKGTHRTGRRANRPPPCSLLATVKRDIGRPVACVVCLAISHAVCRLFLLACKTMYHSELCSHTAAFLQLPNDSTSGKSIQMSSNRLIIRHFSLRQQLGVILTAIRRAISLPEILILHRQHALYYSDTPPLRLPAYLRMCYRNPLT
ncbi:uncharacterized protein TNCV_5088501 [Trichonephila clavipes]|nr:uncharacterized protein TNCV_5088501 [Trichonephila clavipes]